MLARAYCNHGRWVADCPRPYCGNARRLEPGQTQFWCGPREEGYCQLVCQVVWPDDAQEIWDALNKRPVPATRNWFPPGHDLAVRAGCPHGQTAADLLAENDAHGVR